MFFLLMTSILPLPLHHLLFSVWAAHLPVFPTCPPTPTHLGYSCRVTGGGVGLGWRQGRAMISSRAHEEGILGVVWLESRPSLCPLKTTAGWGGVGGGAAG